MSGRLHPQASDTPQPTGYQISLVIVSESDSRKSASPQFITKFEYKIEHISKTKYRKLSNLLQNPFQNIAHLLRDCFFRQTILRILNDHISKTKNRKNRKTDFSLLQIFHSPQKKSAFFEGEGVCMSLTRTPASRMAADKNFSR